MCEFSDKSEHTVDAAVQNEFRGPGTTEIEPTNGRLMVPIGRISPLLSNMDNPVRSVQVFRVSCRLDEAIGEYCSPHARDGRVNAREEKQHRRHISIRRQTRLYAEVRLRI